MIPIKRSALCCAAALLCLAASGPALALPCALAQPVYGQVLATGSPGAQRLLVELQLDENTLMISLDCNADGDFTDGALGDAATDIALDELQVLQVQLRGNDNVEIRSTGTGNLLWLAAKILVVLGPGTNNVSFRGNPGLTVDGGYRLTLEVAGGAGKDTVDLDFEGTYGTAVLNLRAELGAGNDTLLVGLPAAGAGSVVTVDAGLGLGTNSFTLQAARPLLAGSDVSVNLEGGAGVDVATASFSNDVSGQLRVDLDLGAGNNAFNTAFDPALSASGGFLGLSVASGLGRDTFNLTRGASGLVAGTLDLRLNSGGGNDTVNLDFGISGLDDLRGRFRLRGDTGAGNDFLALALAGSTPAAATGVYDVVLTGGNGTDVLSVTFDTGGDGAVSYGPAGAVLVDGNLGPGDACELLGSAAANLHKRSCEL